MKTALDFRYIQLSGICLPSALKKTKGEKCSQQLQGGTLLVPFMGDGSSSCINGNVVQATLNLVHGRCLLHMLSIGY